MGAAVLVLLAASGAQAQCTSVGLNLTSLGPIAPVAAQAAKIAAENASASVGALVTAINSVNTAFLPQSSAFIGSAPNPQPDQEGGGVWARGVGGHLSVGTTATAEITNLQKPYPGNVICNTRTLEDFAGVQIGTDLARLNVNGWNLHAGSIIGYVGSKTQDATPDLNPPTNFRNSLQIPFVGVYGAASYGGFLVDGQVRGDFFENEISDDNHGLSDQHLNARSISLTGNAAYNQMLGNQWFIEPSAGINWSRTHVDPVHIPGNGVLGVPVGLSFTPPGVLTVNDIESTLGRLSLRVGTTLTSGNTAWQPFVSAGVFHEFQGGVTSSAMTNFSAIGFHLPTLGATVSTGGLGTYGQFGLGVSAQVLNSGWVSYLRGDYRTGDNIEGWSVNGGLRYQFVPDPGIKRSDPTAKAMIYKAPPTQAAYNWTGLHVGASMGTYWGFTNWSFANSGATINPQLAGLLGGGEAGYDYQLGKLVFGVEGETGWTNAHGAQSCPTGFFYNCEFNAAWLSTFTARIGYAYWDRVLPYVKGGTVIGRDRAQSVCDTNSRPTIIPLAGCPSQSDSKTRAGWTVGGGSEFALMQNVSVKGEIMYFDLGSDRYSIAGTPTDIQRNGLTATVGLQFRWGR
jgi:opacity protein-like surface antigen